MIFFSSDHHFGDERFDILMRPFNSLNTYIDTCVKRWNDKVQKSDRVYYIGDIACGKNAEFYLRILSRLNGKKYLIPGNHDKSNIDVYRKYFDKIYTEDGILLKIGDNTFYLNHYPSQARKDYWNLCGHIHHSWKIQKNTINVGVDCWHFYPVSIDEINFLKNAICNFYDDDVWAAYNSANLSHKNRGKQGSYYNKK